MFIFKKKRNYGRLGKLIREEWKDFLNSDNGLFKRAKKAPESVVGPSLTDTGTMVGNMMAMETIAFGKVASNEQSAFFEELKHANPEAAIEYMLKISGSIDVWKKDIKWIRTVLRYVEKEEHFLEEEEELITKEERLKAFMHLPPILKKHYPMFFENIELQDLNFGEMLRKIRTLEEKTKKLEKRLREDIEELKKETPFLFE